MTIKLASPLLDVEMCELTFAEENRWLRKNYAQQPHEVECYQTRLDSSNLDNTNMRKF